MHMIHFIQHLLRHPFPSPAHHRYHHQYPVQQTIHVTNSIKDLSTIKQTPLSSSRISQPVSNRYIPILTFLENLNESTIRGWFSQFGPLDNVILDPYVRKVTLVYEDHESASKAWNDPRPVFENRFVKIWWKKQDSNSNVGTVSNERVRTASGTSTPAGPSPEELEAAKEAARIAEKEFEEKQRKKVELENKKKELERQRIELLERQKREKEILMEKIRKAREKKAKETPTPSVSEANGNGEHKEVDGED